MAAANRDRGRRPPVVAVKRGKKKNTGKKYTRKSRTEAVERSERHRLAKEGHSSGAAGEAVRGGDGGES